MFTPRFRSISAFERIDYFATLLATAAAAVLLIAPTAYHRILFRRGDKQYLVKVANRCTVFGLAAIAVAMIGVVLLISDVMFSSTVTIVTTTIVAAGCATTWFLMPLARRQSPQPAPALAVRRCRIRTASTRFSRTDSTLIE